MRNESFTTVAVVHCETSTGIINPVEDVARLVASLQPGTVWTPFALPLSLLACVCHEFAFYIFHPLQALFTLPFVTSFETNNLILLPNHFFFKYSCMFFSQYLLVQTCGLLKSSVNIFKTLWDLFTLVSLPGAAMVVDAMSSFGAVPLDISGSGIDYVVSSANKCLEGVPGFSFAICRTKHLLSCKG